MWSIAAGPLVNVVLVPITFGAFVLVDISKGIPEIVHLLVYYITVVNILLLVFNMLPVYPLDGGQILQALLWFKLGRARSLRIAATVGIVAAVVGGLAALMTRSIWFVVLAFFVGMQSYNGLRTARYLEAQERYYGGADYGP